MTLHAQLNGFFSRPRKARPAPGRYFAHAGGEHFEIRNRGGVWYADLPSGQLSSVLFRELKLQVREAGYDVIPQTGL